LLQRRRVERFEVGALEASDDVYFDAVTRVSTPSWSVGRVALVGDAASSITIFGVGSSTAIAGARTLGIALAGNPADPATAFASYESEHRPRVQARQRGARLGSHLLIPATAAAITLRDVAVRTTNRLTQHRSPRPTRTRQP
jgi:2-polyprenyl-6-methoxyphenol hydroxylase-like FAD-dependent oxidoreductase